MSGQKANPLPQLPIAISPPELWRLEFKRKQVKEQDIEVGDEVPLLTGLSIARLATDEIGVELSLSIQELPQFAIEVSYRSRFQVQSTEQVDDLAGMLKTIAARIAPATLYPFVRETVASVLARAGVDAPLLPVLNFAKMFDPDEIELPPIPGEND